jgi:hypothetical protein
MRPGGFSRAWGFWPGSATLPPASRLRRNAGQELEVRAGYARPYSGDRGGTLRYQTSCSEVASSLPSRRQ